MKLLNLPRAVIPIYGTTFADTLGYTLMIPLLPTLVHQYHLSDVMGGALLSIPAFCSAVAAPIWGKISDRTGRKTIIMAAQFLSLAGYLLLALAHTPWLILVSRIISGLGGGSLGAVESYIADVTKEEDREGAYAFYGAVFGLAFVIGPVTSGALIHYGVALPFLVAAGLETLNIIFTAFFLPLRTRAQQTRTSFTASLRAANKPGVRVVFVRQFLFIFAVVCFLANFALFVSHTLRMDPAQASFVLATAGAIGGLTLLGVVTPLAGRFGDVFVSQAGLAMSFAAYVLLVFAAQPWIFFIALVLWATGVAMVMPTLTTILSERAPKEERGAIMGMSDSINSIAMIVGPSAGAAIVGADAKMLGVLPALASAIAFAVRWRRKPS